MKKFFYDLLIWSSKYLGLGAIRVFAWIVATGYFIFFPWKVAISIRFYKALFPEKSFFHHVRCAWRQYHNFTTVYVDRFVLYDNTNLSCTRDDRDFIHEALDRGKGGILLMSHMGSWELAAHLLQLKKSAQILLYLGENHKKQIEKIQKMSLAKLGVRIIAVSKDAGTPFDIVEGFNFMRNGGLVSLTGDRLWHKGQRAVPVRFLGHQVFLPETPHIFALLSGAPLLIFFISRKGDKSYHISMSEPIYVRATSRKERRDAIMASAQAYANLLEEAVRRQPYEWYHFEPFLGPKLDSQLEQIVEK
jgi:predicted LPLAT superfamily acyltransferase